MNVINLETYQPAITNPNKAEEVYKLIKNNNPHINAIKIDLGGIETMTTQCAKMIFGRLYIDLGADVFYQNIELANCSDGLLLVIEFGIEHALKMVDKRL